LKRPIGPFAIAAALLAASPGITAQDPGAGPPLEAYRQAVSRYFEVELEEVRILAEWSIHHSEVPVVLFLTAEAGISPDAAASARTRGSTWHGLMRRYGVQVSTLHVTIPGEAPLGALEDVYSRLESTPRGAWNRLELTDDEVVGLINLRVLQSSLRVPHTRIVGAWQAAGQWHLVPTHLAGGGE